MPIDMVEIIATNRRDVPGPAWSMPRRDIRVTAPNARHRTYETAMPIVNYGGSTLRQPPPRRSIPNSPRPPASR